jgi:N-acetylneuraminic acid mutarotase
MLHMAKRLLSAVLVFGFAVTLAACTGGSSSKKHTYTVGGTLSGLGGGLTVTLLNNGSNALIVNSNGPFTFTTALKNGATYSVTVGTQPAGQTCTVANGTGTIAAANVTNVVVTCVNVAATYTIGGAVSGLGAGLSVTLLNNGSNSLVVNANEAFTFTTALASGAAYSVTVGTQPTGQTCTVTNGTGTIAAANVTNVSVTCVNVAGTYTIGGTLSGLGNGLSVTLLNNGGNSLVRNANGAFTFTTALASGAAYAVTVGTQPTGQVCTVTNGAGTVAAVNVTNVGVACKAGNVWAWKGGSNLVAPAGVYGTKGVPAATNAPGGRNWNGSWTDGSHNLWIFGGQGYDAAHSASVLNDLWKYDPVSGFWTWMGGSSLINATGVYGTKGVANAANVPGAREFMTTWTDGTGNLWLFGGFGFDSAGTLGYLNDLWKYNTNTGQWTWVDGPNTTGAGGVYGTKGVEAAGNLPGARWGAVSWNVLDGYIWVFGGYGVDANGVALGYLNDLWRFNPANGRWTWMSGSNTYGALGVYGTKGVPAATNVPGARNYMVSVVNDIYSGKLWLFGGAFEAGGNLLAYNDLWSYDRGTGQWTWVSGSNFTNQSGVYGTKGTPGAANVPGARAGAIAWSNDLYGTIWIFGGAGYDSVGNNSTDLNDLWRYDPNTGQWTWMNGSNLAGAAGVYGTLGVPSVTTQPGARDSGTAWKDQAGNFWSFGGAGYDSQGVYDSYGLNDLFEYFQ